MPPVQRLEPPKPHAQPRWTPHLVHSAGGGKPQGCIKEILGEEQWQRLHPDIRMRFSRERLSQHTLYTGHMKLWRSQLGAIFSLLSRPFGAPLPLTACDDAPAMVLVSPGANGTTVWERWVCPHAAKQPVRVRSTKVTAPGGTLVERLDGGLAMHLSLCADYGALVFESSKYTFSLFGFQVPVPLWLTPGHCRVEHRAEGPGRFSFTLSMRHPFFGLTIFQTGLFHGPD